MCVVSMWIDHKYDEWTRRLPWPRPRGPYEVEPPVSPFPYTPFVPVVPPSPPPHSPSIAEQIAEEIAKIPRISAEELAEFKRFLERARDYDKRTGQKDCEMEEKKAKLKELAKQLGAEVIFPEDT